jgi:hypothetical protein
MKLTLVNTGIFYYINNIFLYKMLHTTVDSTSVIVAVSVIIVVVITNLVFKNLLIGSVL